MSLQTIPLSPISQYSADPKGDAVAALAQVAPGVVPSWIYWNDPGISTAQGTGLWQFKGCAYYTPPGTTDPILFTISCGGCATTSVGGAPAAPAPNFAGMVQSKGPLFGTGLVPVVGRLSGINSQTIMTIAGTNAASVIADIQSMIAHISSRNEIYYYDPPTSSTWGTGIWRYQAQYIYYVAATPYTLLASTLVQTGGCIRASVGGPPAVPPLASWGAAAKVSNLFPFL